MSPSARRSGRTSGAGAAGRSSGRRDREGPTARSGTSTRGPSRRQVLRRRWVTVGGLVLVAAVVYAALFTSLLGVDSVRVKGATSVSDQRVRDAAAVEAGTPLLRVDTDAVRGRVDDLPVVASVEVSRSWPSTVVVSVTERTPVLAIKSGDEYRLVGRDGVVYRTAAEKPAEVPVLKSSGAAGSESARQTAAEVVAGLPKQLRKRIVTVSAETRHTVRFTLADDSEVVWGGARQGDRKARVLAALLTREGSVYDVSSPRLPTVR